MPTISHKRFYPITRPAHSQTQNMNEISAVPEDLILISVAPVKLLISAGQVLIGMIKMLSVSQYLKSRCVVGSGINSAPSIGQMRK